jgi:hypothetical protein
MRRAGVLILVMAIIGGCQTGGTSIVSDRTPPGRYELIDPKTNRRLTVLEIPPGQRVGMEYENGRKSAAAVVLSEKGGRETGIVWRQPLPKGSHYQWRPVAVAGTTTQP